MESSFKDSNAAFRNRQISSKLVSVLSSRSNRFIACTLMRGRGELRNIGSISSEKR
jgi:hypothetical protein